MVCKLCRAETSIGDKLKEPLAYAAEQILAKPLRKFAAFLYAALEGSCYLRSNIQYWSFVPSMYAFVSHLKIAFQKRSRWSCLIKSHALHSPYVIEVDQQP